MRSVGARRLATRLLATAALPVATLALLVTSPDVASGQSGSSRPAIRLETSPLSDFYFTLRTAAAGDSASQLPQSMRPAAAQLRALTDFLPERFPLTTQENSRLLVHRKDPKYAAAIDRLLWKRLDPALGTLRTPEDLSQILPDITASLQPLCGNKADSVRLALTDLYGSSYPLYLSSLWPQRRREISAWIREYEALCLPREKALLADLSAQLALPLGDTSQVRILVVASRVPGDGAFFPSRDGSRVSMVIPVDASGYRALGRILHWYLKGSASLNADSPTTALHALDQAILEAKLNPSVAHDLPDALLEYAIGRAVAIICRDDRCAEVAEGSRPYMPALGRAWEAHLSGELTIDEACRVIAASALPTPSRR